MARAFHKNRNSYKFPRIAFNLLMGPALHLAPDAPWAVPHPVRVVAGVALAGLDPSPDMIFVSMTLKRREIPKPSDKRRKVSERDRIGIENRRLQVVAQNGVKEAPDGTAALDVRLQGAA